MIPRPTRGDMRDEAHEMKHEGTGWRTRHWKRIAPVDYGRSRSCCPIHRRRHRATHLPRTPRLLRVLWTRGRDPSPPYPSSAKRLEAAEMEVGANDWSARHHQNGHWLLECSAECLVAVLIIAGGGTGRDPWDAGLDPAGLVVAACVEVETAREDP